MAVSYGVLSTYPPTECGLATFSKSLVEYLGAAGDRIGVIDLVDDLSAAARPEVVGQWLRGEVGGAMKAAAALNTHDVAIIQHEYGVFGGEDGADVVKVARALEVPAIVVLHTVLANPSAHKHAIVQELVRNAAIVVTMTQVGCRRLVEHYAADPGKIRVIPHGAVDNRAIDNRAVDRTGSDAPVILTWGLLCEGKGIEWAIEAMVDLTDLRPAPLYQVVGRTHPNAIKWQGERYRNALQARAQRLGVQAQVRFDDGYLASSDLRRLVRQSDVVLLPYDSTDQVTSGVLTEAITAGKPVVSTDFPHARELLASGAGLIVRHKDPTAIAAALRRVLTEAGLAASMAAEASRIAPELLWPAVADQYRRSAAEVLGADAALATW